MFVSNHLMRKKGVGATCVVFISLFPSLISSHAVIIHSFSQSVSVPCVCFSSSLLLSYLHFPFYFLLFILLVVCFLLALLFILTLSSSFIRLVSQSVFLVCVFIFPSFCSLVCIFPSTSFYSSCSC